MQDRPQPTPGASPFNEFEILNVQGNLTSVEVCKGTKEVAKADQAFSSMLGKSKDLSSLISKLDDGDFLFCVFGGWLRDSLSGDILARDIDLVVSGIDVADLHKSISCETRTTIFGGIAGESEAIPFDIWPLEDTYLIRKLSLPASFQSLLKTADFNINAGLYFPPQRGAQSYILDGGMAESLRSRVIRFNSEHLVLPVVQAARLLAYAAKLNFSFDRHTRYFIQNLIEDCETQRQVVEGLRSFQPKSISDKAEEIMRKFLED
ncbi:hypothetical protein [Sulfitobacter sp. 1A13730]|uniref:hypothetical protein n=1 Tax=Sulfitobacter sp. 1A13730 TaxID=3368569 RepID=UPI003746D501